MMIIDKMGEQEVKKLLNDIVDIFNIGENAITPQTILANIENAARRSHCLSRIESYHTVTGPDENDEEYTEDLLNWGESPEKYIETYKSVIEAND